MAVTFSNTNKPLNPRGNDASPLAYNRAALYSGKALSFDGVNDSVTTTYASGFTGAQEFTYCAYINTDTNQDTQAIIHADENAGWGLQSLQIRTETNGIRFLAGTGSAATSYVDSEVVEANKWYFVVGTHTPTENKIYLNGVLNATATANNLTIAPDAIIVGAYPALANPYNGEISNVKVFNTALTAAQIADLYNNPEKIVPTGVDNTALKLWLPMMESAGTTAYDGSGNGNHGTISGATYVNGVGAPVAQTSVIDWNKGTNKAQYAEEFENAYWSLVSMQTPTANDTTAPDGQTTADKVTPTASTSLHYIWNTTTALTGQNTISVFAKYNGYSVGIRPQAIGSNKSFVNFDLQNGVILSTGGNDYNDSSITDFGNGWYRCSMTMTNATTYGINFYAIEDGETLEVPIFTADGTSGFYLWGAQVNAGATLTPYVRTGATAQTTPVLLPAGLTTGRDITGVNLFENVRKQGALNLDGSSYAEVHDNASLDVTDAVTLEAWVYWDDTQSSVGILGKWNTTSTQCYLIYSASNSRAQFYISSTGANAQEVEFTIPSNGWVHIVGTEDGTNHKLYINGTEEATKASLGSIFTNNRVLEIGRYDENIAREYGNQIAQPRIYNRALTASEVLRNYNSGKNTYTNS